MNLSDIDEDEPAVAPAWPSAPHVAPSASNAVQTDSTAEARAHAAAAPPAPTRVNLDDLFADRGSTSDATAKPTVPSSVAVGTAAGAGAGVAAPAACVSTVQRGASPHDVLDSLFTAPPPPPPSAASAAMLYVDHTSGTLSADKDSPNLLDLSRPAERQRYKNAESFLEAFERQGRRGPGDEALRMESLEHLTRNKDDNKIKARLLALMNYYDVLGVSADATVEEIKRSYKKKALELHPDKVGRAQTAEEADLFKIITKAHETLTDSTQRAAYDAELRAQAADPGPLSENWLQHLQNSA